MKVTIFLGAGASAAEKVPIQNELFIEYFKNLKIDDYNKNLNEWNGIAVKALNGINSHQSVFEEIDLTIAEKVLHESIDSKHNLTCLNLVAELIETEKNKITELIPDKNLKKTYEHTKE